MVGKILYEDIKEYINSEATGNGCKLLFTQGDFEKAKIESGKSNSNVKLKISCSCGDYFYVDFGHFKYRSKNKCNKCSNHVIRKYDDIKTFIEKESNCKLLSDTQDYTNDESKLRILCNCGNEFITDFRTFKNNNKRHCNECGKNIRNTKRRKSPEIFEKEVYELVGDEYTVLNKYINSNTKITIRHNCNNCNNYQWEIKPTNFLTSGDRCPKCAGNARKTTKGFAEEVRIITNGEYSLISEYKNSKINVKLRHNSSNCNDYEYDVSPSNFYHGDRCPKCSKKLKKTTDIFKQEVYNLVKDEYTILGEYKTAKTKLLIKHNECNHEYNVTPDNFLRGKRCPFCNNSKGEKTIDNVLAKNNIIYSREYIFDDLNGIGGNPLRYDFAIFNNQAKTILKLLIEYDGEFHYKKLYKEHDFEGQIYRDNLKNEYCKENNIDLLRIPYWDFDNIEEILNNKLKQIKGEI